MKTSRFVIPVFLSFVILFGAGCDAGTQQTTLPPQAPTPAVETAPVVANEEVTTQPIEEAPAPTAAVQTTPEPTVATPPAAKVVQPASAPSPAAVLPDPTPAPVPAPTPAPAPAIPSGGPTVKKSNTSICHQKGTRYYDQTKNYTAYATLQACLDSGGRLPK
ncbi:MAG: hypothetical protein WC787_02350 [Patescibacteria group bacterium]|jgi:hypothetical protein